MQPARSGGLRRPAIWIGLGIIAIVGVIVSAASSGRRGAASSVAIADVTTSERLVHPGVPHAPPATLADASRVVSIEMYSAVWCQACSRAKAWMREQGITYHEVDVDQRAGALAQLQMLNPRRSLPTFDVDGQVLVGFEESRLRAAIDDAARRR